VTVKKRFDLLQFSKIIFWGTETPKKTNRPKKEGRTIVKFLLII
jgi:hypothetical protein